MVARTFSSNEDVMPASVVVRYGSSYRPNGGSAEVRLAARHGGKPKTWHSRIYGETSAYRLVAQINEDLVSHGESERALTLMVPIDASLATRQRIPLECALHLAELKDAEEQMADENFRDKLRQGTATPDDAREYIRRSIAARAAAEDAIQEARAWIDAQKGTV